MPRITGHTTAVLDLFKTQESRSQIVQAFATNHSVGGCVISGDSD